MITFLFLFTLTELHPYPQSGRPEFFEIKFNSNESIDSNSSITITDLKDEYIIDMNPLSNDSLNGKH